MANLTDADKVLRNDVGKSIVSKLDDIADAIVQHGGGAESLGQLSDVDIDTTTLAEGQSIVYNETTQKFENGQVSTVGGLNDLDDVTLTNVTNKQELVYDDNADVFKNKTTRIELTQAQYDALVTPDPDVDYYITDAPSMTGTSQELSYDGGTDSTYDVIEEVKDDVGDLSQLSTSVQSSLVGAVNEVNGKVNAIGTIVQGSSTGGSAVFTRTWAAKASITLTKGVWIVNTRVLLQQDNNGYRALNIATSSGESTPQCTSPAVNGNLTSLNMAVVQRVTSESLTFYLNGVHNSTQNSELSMVSWYLNAVRIA